MYYGYIYVINNKISNKKYIGQTIKYYKKRWSNHINLLKNNKHNNNHLQNSWNKYGEENFEFILLHELIFDNENDRKNMLDLIEKIYIVGWNLLDDRYGYNISSGGSNGNNFAGKSEEEMNDIKNKMSENTTGKNNPFYGKHHTEETKEKISNAKMGKYIGNKNPMFGKHHTEEAKKKMSNANKNKFGKDSNHYGIGKKIAMIDKNTNKIVKIYNCIADASEEICGYRKNKNIGKCANGCDNVITVCGYKWRFLDDNNNIILNNNDTSRKIAMLNKDTEEVIVIFNSIVEANLYLNKDRNNKNIGLCLNSKNKTAFGYKWKYVYIKEEYNW